MLTTIHHTIDYRSAWYRGQRSSAYKTHVLYNYTIVIARQLSVQKQLVNLIPSPFLQCCMLNGLGTELATYDYNLC